MNKSMNPLHILENIPEGVFAIDRDCFITYFNHKAEEITVDLAKLSIDRSAVPVRRRRRWLWWLLPAAGAAAVAAWYAFVPRAASVQTTPVVTSYPSPQFVVLNATGSVVAQRTAANHSSMLQDIRNGRQTEIDAICGEIVRLGEQCGVPTPLNRVMWQLVRAKGNDNHHNIS